MHSACPVPALCHESKAAATSPPSSQVPGLLGHRRQVWPQLVVGRLAGQHPLQRLDECGVRDDAMQKRIRLVHMQPQRASHAWLLVRAKGEAWSADRRYCHVEWQSKWQY